MLFLNEDFYETKIALKGRIVPFRATFLNFNSIFFKKKLPS